MQEYFYDEKYTFNRIKMKDRIPSSSSDDVKSGLTAAPAKEY